MSSEMLDALKEQMYYMQCYAEAARMIRSAMMRLVNDDNVTGSFGADAARLAADELREAMVLAREDALEQEAEATACLAQLYRCSGILHDGERADTLYQTVFDLFTAMSTQRFINALWAMDVMRKREKIQRQLALRADEVREPVLQKHKELLGKTRLAGTSQGLLGKIISRYMNYTRQRERYRYRRRKYAEME